jgi:outer membrane protein insertion porin family
MIRAFLHSFYLLFCPALLLFTSCSKKIYPKEKPFVYQNKIEIENDQLTRDQRAVLTSGITTQLDDSMQVKIRTSVLIFKRLIDPAVFDTAYAEQSVKNIDIYLKTIGYYNGKSSYVVSKIDTVHQNNPKKKEIRVTTTFRVKTGPVFRINEIEYFLADPELQKIACENAAKSFYKKGEPFSEALAYAEVDRLIEVFRNKGYYKITRDQFFTDTDTVFRKLLNPPSDPLELFEVLQEARERRVNPIIDVYIRTKPVPKLDTNNLRLYTIRNITVYPEYAGEKTDSSTYNLTTRKKILIKSISNQFKPSFITDHISLQPGSMYSDAELNKAANELNNLGVWQFIKIQPKEIIRPDTSQLDIDFLLQPAGKYAFSSDLESVFNSPLNGQVVQAAGNLVGIGLNLGLTIKNFAKQGILFNNTLRGGVEFGVGFGSTGLQSTEITYSNSIVIPKIPKIFHQKKKPNTKAENAKSFINTTVSNINRNINDNGLFRLTTITSNYGWQFQTKKKELWSFRPINVEYVNLYNQSPAFRDTLDRNPSLKNSFTEGLVVGNVNASYFKSSERTKQLNKITSSLRVSLEESGAILGRIKKQVPVLNTQLFEYIKLDAEYKYQITKRKTAWVFRTFAGAGYLYGDDSSNMPFFKQYIGGGPNSMRAWPLRSVGPGAKPLDARVGRNQFFTRTGDIIFESNVEYRYDIANLWPGTLVLRGALFTDVGNIWNFRKKQISGGDTVVLQFKDFYKDLTVSAGTGLRLDFIGLFLLRFDFGLRVKYPALPSTPNAGWRNPKMQFRHFVSGKEDSRNWRYENLNFSLGINYPF